MMPGNKLLDQAASIVSAMKDVLDQENMLLLPTLLKDMAFTTWYRDHDTVAFIPQLLRSNAPRMWPLQYQKFQL